MKDMKRRDFLKMASALSAGRVLPVGFGVSALAQQAQAASPDYSALEVEVPDVMPQVINIFMYGGASELAGNLTNIEDINANSVNSYTDAFGDGILQRVADNPTGFQVTDRGCWKDAGGAHMEDMMDDGDMAIYRTIFKKKRATRSHRESIFMSHKGTIDIEGSPGIGSRLALMLKNHESELSTTPFPDGQTLANISNAGGTINGLEALTLPFVSFEGDSQTYATDPENPIPLTLRGLTMDESFNNPYRRSDNPNSESAIASLLSLRETEIASNSLKYTKAFNGFEDRKNLETNMDLLRSKLGLNQSGQKVSATSAEDLGLPLDFNNGTQAYPNTTFGRQVEAAVTLALHNPQTLYMAMGTPGLGGWDDHNNGVDDYPGRMDDLMEAIKVGMKHIKAAGDKVGGIETIHTTMRTRTDNIIINVFGDFGRLVNLNNSKGWDHANNQNLYTFGGVNKDNIANSVRPPKEAAAMGTVVGVTERQGTPKTNNQYTVPVDGSPTFEPMSIAASIYGYFGAINPQVMTSDDRRLEDGL